MWIMLSNSNVDYARELKCGVFLWKKYTICRLRGSACTIFHNAAPHFSYLVHKYSIVLNTSSPLLLIFTRYPLNTALESLLSLHSQYLTSIGSIVSKPKTQYHTELPSQSTQTTLKILPSPDPHTKAWLIFHNAAPHLVHVLPST